MCKIRSIFALWCCLSLFYCSSIALAQEGTVSYPFVSEGQTVALYPYYGFVPNALNSPYNNFAIAGYNLTNSSEGNLDSSKLLQAFLAALEKRGFTYQPVSEFGSGLDGYLYQVNEPSSHFPFQNDSSKDRAVFFKTVARVFYRLTPFPDTYDVFCYFVLTGVNNSGGYLGFLTLDNGALSVNTYLKTVATSSGLYSFPFGVVFRAKIYSDSYELISTDQWGLPLDVADNGHFLVFKGRSNNYWNTPTRTLTSTDYLNVDSIPENRSPFVFTFDSANFPFYSSPVFEYPIASANTSFHNRIRDDTDSGGMLDIQEWYQTNHDLLDPADDDDDTESLPPPDPEEGEYVVDVGKDTVDRYGHYWDDSIGDENELPTINPTSISPPDDITPEDFDIPEMVDSAQERLDYHMERTAFKTEFDSLFAPLSNSDQKLTWTFNPSVHTELADIELANITIDPQEIVQDQNYGPYFTTFRGCLVLFEFMCFIYGCYKMILSDVSGTGRASATEDET